MVACDKCITKVLEFKLQSNSELNENNSRSHKKKKKYEGTQIVYEAQINPQCPF